MIDKKENKTNNIIKILQDRLHYVEQMANGQIKVNGVDFWCTTEKFWDAKAKVKGRGLKNFIEYLEAKKEKER